MTIKELKECYDANRRIIHKPTKLDVALLLEETYSATMDNVVIQLEHSTTERRVQLDDLLVL
jgi:hypothetical protein